MIGSVGKTWTALRGFAHSFLVLSDAEGHILADGTPLGWVWLP